MSFFRFNSKPEFLPEAQSVFDIVQGCVKAKRESQKAFYQMYYGFSMAICARYCAVEEDTVEVVNDGFLKIFRQLHIFQPQHEQYEASLKGWMKSIFIHTAIDHYRKNKKNQFLAEIHEDHFQQADSQENAIDKLTYREIIELVQRLSPTYRTVFNLYVIDGYKHEEIANRLKISVGASKSNLSKARANIQKMLKDADTKYYEGKAV